MEDFVKVDLHIHTPASRICYKGGKQDEEYLEILASAIKNGLRIISFTDHNTIAGYKKLQEIKKELEIERRTLKKSANTDEVALGEVEKKLGLFEKVLILPGVEFEVQDCVHMLLIFNPTTAIEKIECFLYESGFKPDDQGCEDGHVRSSLNIMQFYEKLGHYDCLCFDAHTDKAKGINEVLKHQQRLDAFSSPRLNGVCYSNEKTHSYLTSLFANSVRRKVKIPLMQFSDAHMIQDIGSKYTWFKLEQISFDELVKTFKNPAESISVVEPETDKILSNLTEDNNTIFIKDISRESYTDIIKSMIALMNTDDGHCII